MKNFESNTYLEAALVADSLSLGPHWIYNQSKLTRSFPNGVFQLSDPLASYHPNKKAGDFTHYGDQTLWLQESISQQNGYQPDQWKKLWLERMSNFSGYIDSASKEALASAGTALTSSNDLAGASRIAPLLDLDLSLEDTISAARSQTELTHGDLNVIDAAEFFTRAVFAVKAGSSFDEAFQTASQTGSYQSLTAQSELTKAREADPNEHLKVATDMGLTCHFPEAFPLTLYYAIHHGDSFSECISKNALAGGDTSARAMILALLFAARGELNTVKELSKQLNMAGAKTPTQETITLKPGSQSVQITGPNGALAGVIEMPELSEHEISTCAIFAHCFTCGKDYLPEKKVTQALAKHGIATLRIDFSGIGSSSGEFVDSSFLTNVEDIYAAAEWLRSNNLTPSLLVGHSLGGSAVLAAASNIPEAQAIATIGSPADPAHILHLIGDHYDEIEQQGQAEVPLAGRTFTIGKQFITDLKKYDYISTLNAIEGHKLIMHSPTDEIVELKNAGEIYSQLKHPKSFIALADADHLLTHSADADFVAQMIATWAKKILNPVQ